jgi:hypothetical protein
MGPRWQSQLPDMTLGNDAINWSSSIKYLGVTIAAGPVFKTDINILTRKFFASCNAVLGNCVHQTQLLRLSLMESYCLPVSSLLC